MDDGEEEDEEEEQEEAPEHLPDNDAGDEYLPDGLE
jgi:hypothetical protein